LPLRVCVQGSGVAFAVMTKHLLSRLLGSRRRKPISNGSRIESSFVAVGDPVEIDDGRVWEDRRAADDATRARCPVARVDDSWMVLRHAEVVAAATDPTTYSSAVSTHRAIPNSLDGVEHAAYREIVDRFLTPERVAREEPRSRALAAHLVDGLPRGATVKTIASIGVPFAVRSQSAWLGWPSSLEEDLVEWMRDNHASTRSGDRRRTAAVADRFDRMIGALVEARRGAPVADVTGELMHETVQGRPLTEEEIVSILRNWTAGDLGSLATSVGVVVHFLAATPAVQRASESSPLPATARPWKQRWRRSCGSTTRSSPTAAGQLVGWTWAGRGSRRAGASS
jgi:cytochrome P450